MSTDTPTIDSAAGHAVGHDDGYAHPTDLLFVKTAIVLAVITAVEVAWSYLPWGHATGMKAVAEVGGLLVMMAAKFVIIAAVFMHLRFDNRILNRVFYAGVILAVAVYLAVLCTFEVFS